MENIGKKIAEFRKSLNMQQDEFADKIGVSRQALSLWETGKQIPRSDRVQDICKIFGVNVSMFYGKDSEEQFAENKKSPLELFKRVLAVCDLVIGWLLIMLLAFVVVVIFIVAISPNTGTNVAKVTIVDYWAVAVVLIVCAGVFALVQILRTIVFFMERREQ